MENTDRKYEEDDIASKPGKKLFEKFNKICEKISKNQDKNDKLQKELDSFKDSLLKFLQPKKKKTVVFNSGLMKKKMLTDNAKKIFNDKFLDEDEESFEELSRQDATIKLCKYIKNNNLKCDENKRLFKIDKTLSKLFNLEENSEISYPHMQKHINKIFKQECDFYPTQKLVDFFKKESKKLNNKKKIEDINTIYSLFEDYKEKNNLIQKNPKKIVLDSNLKTLLEVEKSEISALKFKELIMSNLLIKKCTM